MGLNNATLSNGANFAAGEVGQGFSLDGSDDRAQVADSASVALTASISIEGWVEVTAYPIGTHGEILFRGDSRGGLDPYSLSVEPNGTLNFLVTNQSNAGTSLAAPIALGQFIHVAGTLDDATGAMRIYESGGIVAQQVTTIRPFGPLDSNSAPGVGIGNMNPTGNGPFNGRIDELSVYNRALTPDELLGIYKAGSDGKVLSPISVDSPSIVEGSTGTNTPVTFTIQRTGSLSGSLTVAYATADDTATAGTDYVATSGSISFADGEATKTIQVTVNGDNTPENNESFKLVLTPSGQTPIMGLETIVNDDIGIAVNDVSVTEGDTHFGSLGALVDQGANDSLNGSTGMAFGPDRNLYVESYSTSAVLRFSAATGAFLGEFVTSGSGGLTTPAIEGLSFRPDGKLYVASRNDSSVLRYDATTGAFLDTFISPNSGGVNSIRGMVFGPDGNIYLSSGSTNQVLRYSGTTGAFLGTFVNSGSGGLSNPRFLVFGPDGNLYVSSSNTNSVLCYDGSTGDFLTEFIAANSGGLTAPAGFFFANGSVYVASQSNSQILRFDAATGAFIDTVVAANSNGLFGPIGLLLDASNNLLVCGNTSAILRYGPASRAAFTVSLITASNSPVTVDYSTAESSALAGSDYAATSGTLTFAPGEATKTILVPTVNDTTVEPTETFVVNLSNPVGGIITDSQGVGAIFDDDGLAISIGDATATESGNALTFTVTLNEASVDPVTVDYATADGTAFAGSDYAATSGTVTFAPGETTKTILIPTLDDNAFELTEAFNVNLSNAAGGTIVDSQGIGTILDDEIDNVPPSVTINQTAGQADPTAGTSISFDVVFSEPVFGFDGTKVDLSASSAPGTLVATVSGNGPDYTVTVTGMTGSGSIVASIDAGVVTDLASNPNQASTSSDNSVAFIQSGTVQFSAPTYSINEQGAPTLSVTVTRSGGSSGLLSVDYATVDGTAVANTDFTPASGTLSWAAGDTTDRTINIPILDDGILEPDSTFSVALSNVSVSGALGVPATSTITMFEKAELEFSAADYSFNGLTGTATITVQRAFGSHGAVSVDYATTDGSASAGSDYITATGTLNWADGDTADKTFDIPILNNNLSEGRETVHLTLSGITGYAQPGPHSTATLTIAPRNGTTITANSKTPKSTLTDGDGDLVTLTLAGKLGTLTYYRTNGTGPISEIDLSGTDSTKSVVSITVKKPKGGTGDGRVQIGEIDGSGVKSLSLAKADLNGADGTGINLTSFLGSLTIGTIENGADITLSGAPPTAKGATKIMAGVIGDGTDIAITGAPLGSLTAIAIGAGNITAPSVGSIMVKGRAKSKTLPAIAGDFKSNLTIAGTGLPPKTAALKSLKVAGSVSGSTIQVGGLAGTVGDVGSVSVGSFVNSELLAGYTGPHDGTGSFNLPSTVGSFTVTGKTNGFADSFVIASNFKNVSLASVDPTITGTKFGFLYHTTMKALQVKSTKFKFLPTGPAVQDMSSSDFEVAKV